MSVVKRSNDPNVGIRVEYIDPEKFVHSYTEDPSFDDLVYTGHIKTITISSLSAWLVISCQRIMKDFSEIKGHWCKQ